MPPHSSLVARSLSLIMLCAACHAYSATLGDSELGKSAIQHYGCTGCHVVPGIPNPGSNVAPPLAKIGTRGYIAGVLPNTADNMIRWLRHPQQVDPRTAMPDVGVTEKDAKDIAAYLYTLK